MSSGKVKCTCGWSWNKSDSSKKDMYICHECGRDNSNNMKNGGWLDSYADGGTMQEYQENYNDNSVSLPEGFVGEGYNTKGRDYSPAWGGQFQMGGSIPGAVGFSYARTQSPAPSNGPYAKKTKASAQDGKLIYGSPEYKKAYDENRVAYYDKDSDTYINQELTPIEVAGRAKEKGFWQKYVDKIVEENRGASPLEAAIGVPISAVASLPQLAATYAFTDKMQRPSEAMDIENPYLAMGTDFVLDPLNATGTGVLTKERALARLAASKESGLLSNAYNYNPWAFKPKKGNIYRQVGKPGFEDAVKEQKIFDKGQKEFLENYPETNYLDEYNRAIAAKQGPGFDLKKPSPAPFFSKDDLFFPINRKATGKGNQKTKYSDAEYLFEGNVPNEALLPRYRDSYELPRETVRTAVLRPEYNDLSNFNVYKRDWLQGYKQIPKQEKGGVIKDDMGQWAHPGEITEIGSNQITMQGVPYPVLGISNTGDVQMMYPEEEYEFDGEKVTEFPMAKNGLRQEQKGLVNLDQLTNFTNYNTKQPGGWLDKY